MNSYMNMGAGALLGTIFVLMSVSIASEGIFHAPKPEKEGYAIVAAERRLLAEPKGLLRPLPKSRSPSCWHRPM